MVKKYSEEEIKELKKSLTDLEFSEEEIKDMISKAEEEEIEEETEEEEMKKAYDSIMKMKSVLKTAMDSFLDRFGNVPGFHAPNFDIKDKSVVNDIEKSFSDDIVKGFSLQFDDLKKSIESQLTFNETIQKSIDSINETVNKIAETPNPFKSLMGSYGIIEKGDKMSEDGKKIISLKDKRGVQDILLKSLSVIKEEDKIQKIRDEISNFTVTNKLNPKSLDIVSKAMNVEFEK